MFTGFVILFQNSLYDRIESYKFSFLLIIIVTCIRIIFSPTDSSYPPILNIFTTNGNYSIS